MRLVVLAVLLVACGSGPADGTAPPDGDAAERTCDALPSGGWTVDGACFGMSMGVGLAFDADDCSFTLDDWSMTHGGMPEGGTVDGDAVLLTGGDFEGCEGALDGASMSGVCPDGCAWELSPEQ
jgi:hypothetical protein